MTEFYPLPAFITAITQAPQAVVTFDSDHEYVDGQIISFRVAKAYGMTQINEKQGKVLSHTDSTVTVDIETSFFDAFVYPPLSETTAYRPITVPVGSGVILNNQIPMTNLECTFDHRP